MSEEYKNYLEIFLQELEEKHIYLYWYIKKEDLYDFINNYIILNKIENDYEFIYFLKIILKKINDSHSVIKFNNDLELPIDLKYIKNKLYICNNNSLKQVHLINDIPIEKVIKELDNCSVYNTEGWRKNRIEKDLKMSMRLKCLPSIGNVDTINYKLDDITLSFNLNEHYNINRDDRDDNNCKFFLNKNVAYFKYSKCLEKYDGFVKEKINDFINEVSKHNINTFIFDLRDNLGGKSSLIKPLMDFFEQKYFSCKIITLVNYKCFSSAIFAINNMQQYDSIFVGEPIGSFINHFGEIKSFNLKQLNVDVTYSTKYFYLNNGVLNQITSHEELLRFDNKIFEPVELNIDYPIKSNINNLKNKYDNVLETMMKIYLEK